MLRKLKKASSLVNPLFIVVMIALWVVLMRRVLATRRGDLSQLKTAQLLIQALHKGEMRGDLWMELGKQLGINRNVED